MFKRVFLAADSAAALAALPVHGDDPAEPNGATDVWEISRGGQLYDKWWEGIEADAPKETHPASPEAGEQKGAST